MNYLKKEFFQLLEEDESIFDFIQCSALDGVWYWNLGKVEDEWVNEKVWKVLGYDPAQMRHKAEARQNFIFPEDKERALKKIHAHLENPHHPYDQILRYRHLSGSTVWVHCRGIAIRNENGNPVRMLGAHTNVTHEYDQKSIITKQLEVNQELAGNQPIYIINLDKDAHYTYVNDYYCQDFAWKREELLGKSIKASTILEDRPKYRSIVEKCYAKPGNQFKEILTLELENGSQKTVEWEFVALPNSAADKGGLTLLGIGRDIRQRFQHQQELAFRNDRFRFIAENSSDGIMLLEHGEVLYVSPTYQGMMGYTLAEGKKHTLKDFFQLLDPDDREKIRAFLAKNLANRNPSFKYRFRVLDKKGRYLWWEEQATISYDEEGKEIRAVLVTRDISEELTQKEELQSLLDDAHDLIQSLDEKGNYVFVNKAWQKVLGYTYEEALQLHFLDIVHPKDQAYWRQINQELSSQEQTLDLEMIWVTKNQKPIRVSGKISIRVNEKGERLTRGIFRDITEAHAAQEKLKASQEDLSTILSNTEEGIYGLDVKGNCTFCNVACLELLGYEREEELLGKNMHALIHHSQANGESIPLSECSIYQVFYSGEPLHSDDGVLWRKDGTYFPVELWSRPIKINEEVKGSVVSFINIEARKETENRLLASRKEVAKNNQELNYILEASKTGVWKMDMSSNEFTLDTNLLRMMEWDHLDNLEYRFLEKMIHLEDRSLVEEAFSSFMQSDLEKVYRIEYRVILPKSGEERIHHTQGTKIFDEAKQLTHVIGITRDVTEERKVDREIRYMKKVLEQAGTAANIGVWELNIAEQHLTWSAATREIHEVPEDFTPDIEKGIKFYKEGYNRERIKELLKQCIEEGKPYDEELKIVTYQGNEKWIRTIGTSEMIEGVCVRAFGTFQDIDAQVKAKQVIDAEKQFSNQLIDNMADGFSVIDIDGKQVRVNQTFCEMTGFTEEELLGKVAPYPYWPEEEFEAIQEALFETIKGGKRNFELTFKRKNGERFPVSIATNSLKNKEGLSTNYFANVVDISQRKQAEKELKDMRDFLAQTSKVARVGGWSYDVLSGKVNWTRAIYEIHRVPYDFEPTLEKITSLYTSESQEKLQPAIEKAISTGQGYTMELQIITEKGTRVWVKVIGNTEFSNGTCVRLFGTFQDIDEAVKQREKLEVAKIKAEAASVAKSDFLANMSHEIRTPLNSVVGFTDLLLKTDLNATQLEYMNYVYHSANSLLGLINDILDFSKIEAGKLELSIGKTDLWEMGQQISDIVRYKSDEKALKLLVKIAPEIPRYVFTDPVRLRQVLINLLGNAIKFTEKGYVKLEILLQKTHENNEVELLFAVEDSGIGIPPQKQQSIFEAFTQEDASITRKFGGTGLGLSISNSLLKLMDSTLELESKPGEGSRFYFHLKLLAEPHLARENELPIAAFKNIKHVLIVDDDEEHRQIVSDTLRLKEISHSSTENGFKAIEFLMTSKADVMIIDYQMPIMDGLEVIKKVRLDLGLNKEDVKIILLHSPNNDAKLMSECHDLEVYQVLYKPIRPLEFFEVLLGAINHEAQEPHLPEEKEAISPNTDYTILIADDNAVNMVLARSIVLNILPDAHIVEARNGEEAIECFFRVQPDLVLMDVQMPLLSGYEATRSIRAREKGKLTPIIALTAGTVKGEKERCLEAGMNDYLSKPVIQSQIKKVFQDYLTLGTFTQESKKQSPSTSGLMHFNQALLKERLGNGSTDTIQRVLGLIQEGYLLSLIEEVQSEILNQSEEKVIKSLAHGIKGASEGACFEIMNQLASELELMQPFVRSNAERIIKEMLEEHVLVLEEVKKFSA